MLKFRDVFVNSLGLNNSYRSNRTAAQDFARITIANGSDSKDRECQALNA